MARSAIAEIDRHAKKIASGKHETLRPGMPGALNAACKVGDIWWQGDLGIEIVASVPAGMVYVASPNERERQLAPGSTIGSRHVIRDLAAVNYYRQATADESRLFGPCLACKAEMVIDHPTHGSVTIAAGHTVQIRYQREWDQEQRRERRNED